MVDRPRRFRYAPSPSRLLHIGNGLAAVIGWAAARAVGGAFVLRIEDIDATRCTPEYERACIEDLQWLGLDWDEGPYRQSERLDQYDAALERLAAAGLSYPCTCSRAQIQAAQRAPHLSRFFADVGTPRPYPGTCRGAGLSAPPEGHGGWRLDVETLSGDAQVAVDDRWMGPHTEDVRRSCGDFLLGRAGNPTYQLAAVYDDRAMRITDVVRGSDLIGSAARQRLLHRALDATDGGCPAPTLAHHPLILDSSGRKLSKRDYALSLSGLRADGVRPERVLAAACASVGLVDAATRALRPMDVVKRLGPDLAAPTWRDGALIRSWVGG